MSFVQDLNTCRRVHFLQSLLWPISIQIVSAGPLISQTSSPFTNSFMTVLKAPITIGITVNSKSHSFFYSLARSRFSSHFSLSFSDTLLSARTPKSTIRQVLSLSFSLSFCLSLSFLSLFFFVVYN